jgi:hypothetical protein
MNNILGRDITAASITSAVLPVAYAAVVRGSTRWIPNSAMQLAVGLLAIWVGSLAAFFVVLAAHCSSGDCL